jgi:hypothetical protein
VHNIALKFGDSRYMNNPVSLLSGRSVPMNGASWLLALIRCAVLCACSTQSAP